MCTFNISVELRMDRMSRAKALSTGQETWQSALNGVRQSSPDGNCFFFFFFFFFFLPVGYSGWIPTQEAIDHFLTRPPRNKRTRSSMKLERWLSISEYQP